MSQLRLDELIVGSRLLIRAKCDWRSASVRSIFEEKVILNVASPSGRTYLLRRTSETTVEFRDGIALLTGHENEDWRANLCKQDARW